MLKHINIKVYGSVQGVGFRQAIKAKADSLNITGYTRNFPNGSVNIEAEGEEENLKKLVEWCEDGPKTAKVELVKTSDGPIKEFDDFKAL